MEHALALLAALFFAANFLLVLAELRRGELRVPVRGMLLMAAGFICQSVVLWSRGQLHARCPITSAGEVVLFVAWAIVLWYFVLGSGYRLSLLGIFTSVLVAAMQVLGLVAGLDAPGEPVVAGPVDPWVELHGSLSLLAYGALGVAALAGVMYLIQDHQLKRRHHSAVFFHLPPINQLFRAMMMVLTLGCLLLLAGMLSGYLAVEGPSGSKHVIAYVVLGVYAGLIAIRWMGTSHRRVAMATTGAFAFAVASIWFVS